MKKAAIVFLVILPFRVFSQTNESCYFEAKKISTPNGMTSGLLVTYLCNNQPYKGVVDTLYSIFGFGNYSICNDRLYMIRSLRKGTNATNNISISVFHLTRDTVLYESGFALKLDSLVQFGEFSKEPSYLDCWIKDDYLYIDHVGKDHLVMKFNFLQPITLADVKKRYETLKKCQ